MTQQHSDGSFNVSYVLGGSEKNVGRDRIQSLNPLVLAARRTNNADVERPSVLTPSHQPQTTSPTSKGNQPPSPAQKGASHSHLVLESRDWSDYDVRPNPILAYLHKGRKKEEGWLRLEEREYDTYQTSKNGRKKGDMKSQLSELENTKLVTIKMGYVGLC